MLRLAVTMNGRRGPVESAQTEARGGSGRFDQQSTSWVGELPGDGRLRLTVAWPEIGLASTHTDLVLHGLTDLDARAIPLT
ncbi:hypothetical protein [Cellulomonas sp. ATA003]|uniref:hypothetical protein n=1 Tax=Cellulomonas sp. ATA003 TaxID=3073064 RepID=UPI0028737DA8|nr:hypothetical protein [Cellulomonas sp. ATA003]WNB87204.1 hypothetical protein REH70_08890 [Cellulomonas sp. ATA003]